MKKLFFLPIIIGFILSVIKSPAIAASPIGNYLVLNGGYVKTLNPDTTSPSNFSFHAKVNPTSVSGKQIILSIGDKKSAKLYYEVGINGGILSLSYNSTSGSYVTLNSGKLSAGNWQDIGIQITPTQTILYIDEIQVIAPFINNTNLGPIGPDIVLGDSFRESFPDSKPFKGLMDEVLISGGSIVLNWHLDEVRGVVTARDSSGVNLNGSLIGADNLIHFFGVLPSPTPFTFNPIQWNRPALPILSITRNIGITPTIFTVRDFPRPTRHSF